MKKNILAQIIVDRTAHFEKDFLDKDERIGPDNACVITCGLADRFVFMAFMAFMAFMSYRVLLSNSRNSTNSTNSTNSMPLS